MNYFNSSEQLFHKVADLLLVIRNKIDKETDIVWTRYDDAQHLMDDLDRKIEQLRRKNYSVVKELELLFAPTGAFQEISISNGWGDEFLKLAQNFDQLCGEIR